MKSDIKFVEPFDWIFGYLFLVAPLLVGIDKLAELRPPIAQMIVFDNAVSSRFIDIGQCLPYHRGAEMPYADRLGDVWAGIINQRDLARIDSALAVFFFKLNSLRHRQRVNFTFV